MNIRKNKRLYITDNIADVTDNQIKKLCNKISTIIQKQCGEMNRLQMVSYVEKNIKYVDDDNLGDIENMMAEFLTYEEQDNDRKKRVALEIANKLLLAMNKKKIYDLENFDDVRRDEILNDECKQIIDDNRNYIFENGFSKEECMVYQTKLKYPHLSLFKGMLKHIGYELMSKNRSKRSDGVRDMFTVYYIKNSNV